MEELKKRLRNRQIVLISGLVAACGALLLSRIFLRDISDTDRLPDFLRGFISGFQTGIVLALFGFMLFFLIRNSMAMRNPDRLKKLYIAETDERGLFIKQKAGSVGMDIIMYGLAVAAAVSGNLNGTVFFSLFGACLFVTLIRAILGIYYSEKY
ncbi:MAG TPA: hypothetical protein DEQ02_09555 [Ruminococcaceae bacterium]|nr:hypothetical protein [Oscillospiraceae bacterium]